MSDGNVFSFGFLISVELRQPEGNRRRGEAGRSRTGTFFKPKAIEQHKNYGPDRNQARTRRGGRIGKGIGIEIGKGIGIEMGIEMGIDTLTHMFRGRIK